MNLSQKCEIWKVRSMDKALIDLLFMSQKRKDLLLLLKNGGKTIEEIIGTLNVNPTGMLPQIKKLKDEHLVLQEGIVLNIKHWDMMKFDGTEGNCIFNFIYGHETFPRLPQENLNKTFDLNIGFIPTPVQVDRKQYSYLNAGILHDFVEDKSPVKNIAACGYITNGTHNVFIFKPIGNTFVYRDAVF